MQLSSRLRCYPPLGELTVVDPTNDVSFTAVLDWKASLTQQTIEIVLHYKTTSDTNSGDWCDNNFKLIDDESVPFALQSQPIGDQYTTATYRLALPCPPSGSCIIFTIKYRLSSLDAWNWANTELGTSNGRICHSYCNLKHPLNQYLSNYDTSLKIESVSREDATTRLWTMRAAVEKAEGSNSTYSQSCLGTPTNYSRWFALVRINLPWIGPRHGSSPYNPNEGAILSAFQRNDGSYLVILAVSGYHGTLTELVKGEHGSVIARSRNDRQASNEAPIIVALGRTLEATITATMDHARGIMNGLTNSANQVEEDKSLAQGQENTAWMSHWYEGLGYCTWNGIGKELTEDKILNALQSLADNGIEISTLIIDDNWQSLDQNGRWLEFEANKTGFPHGLKHLTDQIRDKYPNIKHIAVWHAILGYWDAISPHGKIAKSYKTATVSKMWGGSFFVVDEPDIDRMYNDFYQFLVESGIDSVKTDDQCMLDEIKDAPDRERLIMAYQDAWIMACLRNFSSRGISCMSQIPQAIFHNQLPTNRPRTLVRNSDDFFPTIPSSHTWHIWANAHNALLTSHLNTLPDWDMFQSDHEYAAFHAAARCVSGGPIYITDTPGAHDVNLIKQMTAADPSGNVIILRPNVTAKTLKAFNQFEAESLLHLGGFVGGSSGSSILAVFNISERAVSELIHLKDFRDILRSQDYIVRSFQLNKCTGLFRVGRGEPLIALTIGHKSWDILTAHPVQHIHNAAIAVLGLVEKMTGVAAILNWSAQAEGPERTRIFVNLKAVGRLQIYISSLLGMNVKDNFLVMVQEQIIEAKYVRVLNKQLALEIDLENAWRGITNQAGHRPDLASDLRVQIMMHP